MHKPLSPLNYSDLYEICEEVLQLRGAFLQNIICKNPDCYFLQFYKNHQTHWLVFNLTASQPFFLSTESSNPIKFKKTTPVLNFLKAHFKGLALKSVEIASKPNRIVRLIFSENERTITFKCFPHGQGLWLKNEDKNIFYPLGKFEKDEEIAFIEPEEKKGWEKNQIMTENFLLQSHTKIKAPSTKSDQVTKQIEKNILSMESKRESFLKENTEKILKLEEEAKIAEGKNLNKIHLEIKKLKRRAIEFGQKKNQLEKKLDFLKSHPEFFAQSSEEVVHHFPGTRVFLNESFQLWVGRKAAQNDQLVRLASPHELWIHLRDRPSAHGIIRGPKNKEPSQEIIDFCCLVVAQLSQNKKKPFGEGERLDFIVTPRKFVKKKKGMAEGAVIVEREKIRRVAFKKVEFQVLD